MNTIQQVVEFHKAYGHPIEEEPIIKTADMKALWLRLDLLKEELEELDIAINERDTIEVLDALCDLQYVLDGAKLALGFHKVFDAAFAEVHRSNMSKLGEDGRPIYREDGKVMKGPNYSPPNLESILYAKSK